MRNRRSRMYKHRSNGRHFRRQGGASDNLRIIPGSFSNGKKNNYIFLKKMIKYQNM